MLSWFRRVRSWRHEERILKRWNNFEHLRVVPKVKDAPDSISVASLRSNFDFTLGKPKWRSFVPTRRLDFQQPLLPIGLKRTDIVPVSVAIQVGNPTNVIGEIFTPSLSEADAFELYNKLFSGLPQVAISRIPFCGIKLPNKLADRRRQRFIQISEVWRSNEDRIVV